MPVHTMISMTDWQAMAHEHDPMWDDDDRARARADSAALDALGVRHSPQPGWDRGPYQPLGAYGIELPALVAALSRHALPERLPEGPDWIAVTHFSQGFACSHDSYVLTVLAPRPGVAEAMRRLSDLYVGTNLEWPTIDQVLEYRDRLGELLGVTCPPYHATFAEGRYPVEGLSALTAEQVEVPGAELLILGPNGAVDPFAGLVAEERPLDLPALVLADRGGRADLLPGREWRTVRHGGGDLVATALTPRPEVAAGLRELAAEYAGRTFEGPPGDPEDAAPSLDELVAYRDRLRALVGADCSDPLAPLGEGVCPIDLAELHRLVADRLVLPRPGGWELLLLV